MKRIMLACLALLFGACNAMAAPLPLHKGVGLHEWLNWAPLDTDGDYRWPPYRSEQEWLASYRPASDWPAGDPFVAIRALGFDFVRLTVDPGPLLASTGGERQQALDVLSAAVRRLTDAGLKVVFNLHSVTQVPRYSKDVINSAADSPQVAAYVAMSVDVARMLASLGVDKVAFEPFNEPSHYPCEGQGSGDWQKIMAATVAAVRAVSTDLTLVATGACGGSVAGLVDLDPVFDDPNVLYSFHMYEPHAFTHQRLDDGLFGSGLPWPANAGSRQKVIDDLRLHMTMAGIGAAQLQHNLDLVMGEIDDYFSRDWGPAQVEERIDAAVAWASDHGIAPQRLFMGEFGAILMSADGRMGAFEADRSRYIKAVREVAERHGIAWSIWEYSNPYGMSVIEPVGPAVPDTDLLMALGLAQ